MHRPSAVCSQPGSLSFVGSKRGISTSWAITLMNGESDSPAFEHRFSGQKTSKLPSGDEQYCKMQATPLRKLRVSRAILLCLGYGLFSLFATWCPVAVSQYLDPRDTKFRRSCRSSPRGHSWSIHPHHCSWHASTNHFESVPSITASRTLIDSLQHSILGVWLRTSYAGFSPACHQAISSPHASFSLAEKNEKTHAVAQPNSTSIATCET
jgi:hypothetical protein